MSFLRNILSPFVEFTDDKKPEAPKEKTAQPAETNTAAGAVPPPVTSGGPGDMPSYTTSPGTSGTTPLSEHEKYFEKLIEEANAKNPMFQGTDFKEFIDSKGDIEAITDEATRYVTAFNVLKRTGLTKEKLLSTGQEYINLIGRDLNGFQSAHSQQYQKEVNQREVLLQKKAEELQALSEKITALNQEIRQISQEVVKTKEKLNSVKNSFLLAGENKQREIQTELQKIAQYFG